jgi:hypothetical protein
VVVAIHNIDGAYLDRYVQGLKLAGLPDEPRPHAAPSPTAALVG